MIVTTFSVDEIEDPPSRWFEEIRLVLAKILEDPIFNRYQDRIDRTNVSVVFVHDTVMKELNWLYRGKKTTTDVLSFTLNEKLPEEFLLGEIIISIDKAREDAIALQLTLFQETLRLLVHGMTHLLGYDHQNDRQESEMKEIEDRLLSLSLVTEGVH